MTAGLLVAVLGAAAPSAGCAYAVRHPAVTAGVVGGALGFGTCKLASDNLGACAAVGGGAAAFLALFTAAAIWLGGEGSTPPIEERAQPLPEEDRPRRRVRRPPAAVEPAGETPAAGSEGAGSAAVAPPPVAPASPVVAPPASAPVGSPGSPPPATPPSP